MSLTSKLTESKYGLDDLVVAGTFGATIPITIYSSDHITNASSYAYYNNLLPGVKSIACGIYDILEGVHNYYYGFAYAMYKTISQPLAGAVGTLIGGIAGIVTYIALVYGTYKTLKFAGKKLYNKIKEKRAKKSK